MIFFIPDLTLQLWRLLTTQKPPQNTLQLLFVTKVAKKMHVVDRRSIVARFYLKEKGEIFWKMFDQFLFFSCLVYRQNLPSRSVTKMQNWFLSASIILSRFNVFFFLILSCSCCRYFPNFVHIFLFFFTVIFWVILLTVNLLNYTLNIQRTKVINVLHEKFVHLYTLQS